MNDQWIQADGTPIDSDWEMGLPLSDDWVLECGCDGPNTKTSIVDNITITGSPGSITSVAGGQSLWSVVLNDGTPEADFAIQRFDNTGLLIDSPVTIERATGIVTFHDPVLLSRDPVEPMEAVTLEYLEGYPSGIPEAPQDNYTYGRDNAAWVRLPQTYIPEAPNTSQRYGRFNSTWQLDAIQTDAPNDGNAYARQSGAWTVAVTGGPYLPLTGGTITGSLTVNQVLTVQGSNSLVLNAPVTGGNQRAILSQAANVSRWQLALGDGIAEGPNNAGANFTLAAFNVTGGFLGNWLTIARADGSTVFNGSGVTIQGGLAVNGLLALADPTHLAIYGGSAGQALTTNGSGVLSWTTLSGGGGGIVDAPNDGTLYGRKSAAWAHLTHTDITDWTATLAPYALTSAVPSPATVAPIMDGTAAVGTSTLYARQDHVHPSDTSRYAASNPAGYQTAAQVTAVLPIASSTTPIMDGTAAIGTGTTWARADHVHPSDTTRLAISGGTMSGPIVLAADPAANLQAATKQYVDGVRYGDNRIINGDCRVDQRNNGVGGTASGYTIDRWFCGMSVAAKGTWQRSTAGPGAVLLNLGFGYCLTFVSSSAYVSLAADNFNLQQRIEADMIADFAWGTANAQPVTLSFLAQSSLTGTFSGALSGGGGRSYPFNFSLPTANGWQKIVITIPGDTAGTWVTQGNAEGLRVIFDLGSGSSLRGPANAWSVNNYIGVTGAVSVVATNGAMFNVTGVKLEIGSVATPFNRQSLAKSLVDCQRYYQVMTGFGPAGYSTAGLSIYNNASFITMRANPTAVLSGFSYNNSSAMAVTTITVNSMMLYATVTATGGAIASANVALSAEL